MMTESNRYPRAMFWFLAAQTLLLFIWSLVCLGDLVLHPFAADPWLLSPVARLIAGLVIAPASFVVGCLILRREKRNLVGLLMLSLGSTILASTIREGINNPAAQYIQRTLAVGGYLTPIVLLIFYFPNGRSFPPRHARLIDAYLLLLTIPWAFGAFFGDPIDNPFYLPVANAVFEFMRSIWIVNLVVLLILMPYTIYTRYRHGGRQQRLQMKWFVATLFIFLCMLLLLLLIKSIAPGFIVPEVGNTLFYLALLAFPVVAIGNAILRHNLYNIDIVIRRTLVYSALTALVIGLYVLVVGTLSTVFQSSGSLVISLIATGVVAVCFHPLRERLQFLVDHYVYGERNNPYVVISRLNQRLEDVGTPGTLVPGIAETVAQALKLPFVSIAVKSGDEFKTDAVYGQPALRGMTTTLPLMYRQEMVGQMQIGQTAGDKPLDASQHQLLLNIARQVGIAVHAARLSADLQVSRQRIVTAREEERRRLRRDLHDGLGPTLATLTLQAEAAHDLVTANPDKSQSLLNEIIAGLQAALADIRRVVYALRPPALDDLGLISAINVQAAQYTTDRLAVQVDLPEQIPALPAAVEVAAYRIVQEALTNVVRHAQATTCVLSLAIKDMVHLEIHDDGQGIAETRRAGVGLNAMHERAAELGGTCSIQSAPGDGTHIYVTLPAHMEG